ncbi:MAG TPA: hypothetical protein VGF84_21050 [Micromonosporaceae bacterium]|jgi:hypothetical protein
MPSPDREQDHLERIEPKRRTHLLFGTGSGRRGYLLTFRPHGLRDTVFPARRLAEVDRARYVAAVTGLAHGDASAVGALHRLGFRVRRVE